MLAFAIRWKFSLLLTGATVAAEVILIIRGIT